ncbi:hypothetical protein QCB45_05580 [Thiomicrorhabdus sp. ZW0627]|uniref:hypothetical protein n=1 Tax=Thiomicrorhabdus sp. ZW0627 TaxID=3039774 RepID=UPI002437188B|nr:hypothetical protein [Thiomicrorhabdus sp. ZW0627]MDG6773794.1 hypothetical protein [Thiomicrorhabdus sp. ZW0627]
MPGSSHDVDPTFMDSLALSLRDPALDLIRFSSLKEMLTMRKNGPSAYYSEKYSALNSDQWETVLNAVILTKISYFQISEDFPNTYIDKLIEIATYAFHMHGCNELELYQAMVQEHPLFANWIKNCLVVKQQKARKNAAKA